MCGGVLKMEDTGFLTQKENLGGTTLVDGHIGFNELIRLTMLLTVRHSWPLGERFYFYCYKNWAQLLLQHVGSPPVALLIQDGLNKGDTLLLVLYGITPIPLVEDL